MVSLREDKGEAEKVGRSAPRYWLSEKQKLYRCCFLGPYLLSVHPEAMEPLLEELHKGICKSHIRGRSLAHRAFTQEYWWPSMRALKNMQRNVISVRDMHQIFIS